MTPAPQAVIAMGVSGSGKTTLARLLAEAWQATFLDADDIHDDAARARMAAGLPLTDAMRDPWVARIADELTRRVANGERVVLAFSGLRRRHRDRLRETGLPLRFLFLHGDKTLIAARMQARSGHYMPASLLDSQFETLEMPAGEADVVTLAIDRPPAEMLRDALAACT
ncbi:gluconokinase, GntK/IdnK-type [Luteimonas sp. 3794]|uniref:gluconokinase n=1 Tax=Luteimonas sp. 3794 TaxID=2817730 RepID=UPI002858C3C4|nr:gluconokinase, GntK/IdnK-type [Luteimonas sp. 3794]MDR6990281.1 gluconokinase [Luteimonas sp. 3794]